MILKNSALQVCKFIFDCKWELGTGMGMGLGMVMGMGMGGGGMGGMPSLLDKMGGGVDFEELSTAGM